MHRFCSLRFLTSTAVLACCLVHVPVTAAPSPDRWPQWRGPDANGISLQGNLPLQWSEKDAIAWKCKLPEWGNSTPVIWDDAIFVTSHVDDRDLVLIKIQRSQGRIEWTRTVGSGSADRSKPKAKGAEQRGRQKFHNTQNLATPSCVTDGEVVIAHFGNGDLAAYDFSGRQLWKRNLQDDHGKYTIWWGHANSPVLYEDLVISACMQDACSDLQPTPSPSYVVAHDRRTGKQVWKTMRITGAAAEAADSYTTPLVRRVDRRTELLLWGGQTLDAYEPRTGKQLWYLPELGGDRVITGPVLGGEMIYLTQGKRESQLAIRPGGLGKRPQSEVVWRHDEATPDSPTPVVHHGLLFSVADNGIAKCLDARDGKLCWKERLKGQYRASPLATGDRIYFLNMQGLTTVVRASREFERLSENPLDDTTIASPAVAGGRIYLRGKSHLYSIGP